MLVLKVSCVFPSIPYLLFMCGVRVGKERIFFHREQEEPVLCRVLLCEHFEMTVTQFTMVMIPPFSHRTNNKLRGWDSCGKSSRFGIQNPGFNSSSAI